MCLAVPARITKLHDNQMATVDIDGVQQEISVALLEDVAVGEYVIIHVGYALNKLDPDEAAKTLELFEELAQHRAAADA
jgi:hydrogenase expression/formation protein HypC